MSRLMSVSMTEQAVLDRIKRVTRRKGWWKDKNERRLVVPGDRLMLCRKVMGRKKDEPLVRLVEVEVLAIRREPLALLARDTEYARAEVAMEGFPGMHPPDFVDKFFVQAQGMTYLDQVTRIEWRYLEARETACHNDAGCDGISHSLPCNNAWFGRTA